MPRLENRYETKARSTKWSQNKMGQTTCRSAKRALYTKWDSIKESVSECLIAINCQIPFLADEIVKYLPLYSWEDCDKTREVKVVLDHHNTIAANHNNSFGAVLGQRLNPKLDHIINVQVVDGVEFGIGVCNTKNIKMAAKRDFMCEKGGWGYYNYKPKYVGMKPKYPCGWYSETHDCVMRQEETDILGLHDILTMVIAREGLDSTGRGKGSGKHSIRYYKNGVEMGFAFTGLQGPLSLCCNFYFMKSAIQILSDHRLKRRGPTRMRI